MTAHPQRDFGTKLLAPPNNRSHYGLEVKRTVHAIASVLDILLQVLQVFQVFPKLRSVLSLTQWGRKYLPIKHSSNDISPAHAPKLVLTIDPYRCNLAVRHLFDLQACPCPLAEPDDLIG